MNEGLKTSPNQPDKNESGSDKRRANEAKAQPRSEKSDDGGETDQQKERHPTLYTTIKSQRRHTESSSRPSNGASPPTGAVSQAEREEGNAVMVAGPDAELDGVLAYMV